VAVAGRSGIRIEPFAGRLDFNAFLEGRGRLADLRRQVVLRTMGFKYRRLKSSSLQSLEAGQKTEVDYLNGYVSEQAAARGLDVPINDAIVAMVHEIEAGTRSISPSNYAHTAFDRLN
jgi:2-dehydropantoate 2-reductase